MDIRVTNEQPLRFRSLQTVVKDIIADANAIQSFFCE